jgi:hypothetical protein
MVDFQQIKWIEKIAKPNSISTKIEKKHSFMKHTVLDDII